MPTYTPDSLAVSTDHVGSGIVGTGQVLADGLDATYARITGGDGTFDQMTLKFTTPVGTGGLTVADVATSFRVQISSDWGGTGVQVIVSMVDSNFAGFSAAWTGNIPNGSTIYDDGLPIDSPTNIGGDPNHSWTFKNQTPGAAVGDDPWPDATNLMAAGSLTVFVSTHTPVDPPPGKSNILTLYEFTITENTGPVVTPPLRLTRNDGLGLSSGRRLAPVPKSIQASNRRAGGYL